ncbi:MAG: CaiB/BaiF CoA transferase family protein [Flavobacteriales bacterium]
MLLKNLKVIELSSVLAGPLVGTFFAELGAKVIKVENKRTGGDVTRTWRLPSESPDNPVSAYYASANFGKECLFLDYSVDDDYQLLIKLVKDADIVLVNFKPGDAEKFNLTYQDLEKIKPDLIYAAITGFGEDDPRIAFDVVLQAETGFMSMNGEPESLPLKMPLAMIDIFAAHQLKEGILCALIERQVSGKGAHVKVSLFDAAVTSLANQAANFLMNHHDPKAIGSIHPNIAPYGELFKTADHHYIVLAVGNDKQFAQLCKALGAQELMKNPKFSSNPQRVANRKDLHEQLKSYFTHRATVELERLLLQYAVPFGRVRNLNEVFELDNAKKLIHSHTIDGQECLTIKTIGFSLE